MVLLQTLKLSKENITSMSPLPSDVLGKLAYLCHLYLPERHSVYYRKNFKFQFSGLSKLETLENFNTLWCEVKDLSKLSNLRRLKLVAEGGHNDVKEMLENLFGIAQSSTSYLRYLDLDITILDQGFQNDPHMITQLLWNDKFYLQQLTIRSQLPELAALFEQQQQLNATHTNASFIHITSLNLRESCLEEDPMPIPEKIPTLRVLTLNSTYKGKAMVCSPMGFLKLTKLVLESLNNLEKWRVEEGSMPILGNLEIWICGKLEELPEVLIFLNYLRKLKLMWMPAKFSDRVRLENGEQGPEFYKIAHVPISPCIQESDEINFITKYFFSLLNSMLLFD